jgi:16S rRNA (cytidine1402-2'-O)-methyltransferase
MTGKLILLPNLLDESLSPEAYLPASLGSTIKTIQGLIAESEKSARRYLRKFLSHDEMAAMPLRLLNEHTPESELAELLAPIEQGECWGLISDAGLPCMADPGADLVWKARSHRIQVETHAGPSSIVYALQLSGFPSQRFTFHGYLPREIPELEQAIRNLEKQSKASAASQLFIEAPYRSAKILDSLLNILAPSTRLCVAASLTTPEERVVSQTVAKWKNNKIQLGKEPAVFVVYAD